MRIFRNGWSCGTQSTAGVRSNSSCASRNSLGHVERVGTWLARDVHSLLFKLSLAVKCHQVPKAASSGIFEVGGCSKRNQRSGMNTPHANPGMIPLHCSSHAELINS